MMELDKLKAPFRADDIEWKPGTMTKDGSKALAMAYVTARAIQDRLDEVCGPENWSVTFRQVPGGTMCAISILTNSGWVTKEDGSDSSDIEPFKGGISGAMKRAGAQWGIGRYLYNLDAMWVECESYDSNGKKKFSKFKRPPQLPSWALPDDYAESANNMIAEFSSANTLEDLELMATRVDRGWGQDMLAKVRAAYSKRAKELEGSVT